MNDNFNLEDRILELEKRVSELEKINKRRLIFKIIGIILALILIFCLIFFIFLFYKSILDNQIFSSFMF